MTSDWLSDVCLIHWFSLSIIRWIYLVPFPYIYSEVLLALVKKFSSFDEKLCIECSLFMAKKCMKIRGKDFKFRISSDELVQLLHFNVFCKDIYIHTYMHTCICAYIYTYRYVHTYMHLCINTCIHIYKHTYLLVCMLYDTCMHTHTIILMYIHTYVRTYISVHADTYVCMHTCTIVQYIHAFLVQAYIPQYADSWHREVP